MGAFSDSLKINSDRLLEKINKKCYQIAKEAFTLTVKLSPSPSNPGKKAEGLLANQWWPMNGKAFSNSMDGQISDIGGSSLTRINALQGTQFLGKDGSVTLANNLPYAGRAEYIGWYPPKWSGEAGFKNTGAPYRMVAQAIQITAMKWR